MLSTDEEAGWLLPSPISDSAAVLDDATFCGSAARLVEAAIGITIATRHVLIILQLRHASGTGSNI